MNLLIDIKDIGSRKDVRTDDIIGFLTANGVTIVPINGNYETIMTTELGNPSRKRESESTNILAPILPSL